MRYFSDISTSEVYNFVCEHPLAWIVPNAKPFAAALMPVLFEDDDCRFLFGHLPVHSETARTLGDSGSVTCLFLGPHSYISPDWLEKKDWAPTWNFVSVKMTGQMHLNTAMTRDAVERLVQHMQKKTASNWSLENLEHRLETLLKNITGFRLEVTQIAPRFKVGQDENDENYERIYSRLRRHPISRWMKR